jgi:hypothetical protein
MRADRLNKVPPGHPSDVRSRTRVMEQRGVGWIISLIYAMRQLIQFANLRLFGDAAQAAARKRDCEAAIDK